MTPSHQAPTAVTMSMERREALLEKAASHNMRIIEDDFDSGGNYLGNPHPALKSIDTGGRVIYMSCLSRCYPRACGWVLWSRHPSLSKLRATCVD